MNLTNIKNAICGAGPTCCEANGISDCNQGRNCPANQHEYSVRVIRPGVAPFRYSTRAADVFEAANDAEKRHGIASTDRIKVREFKQ